MALSTSLLGNAAAGPQCAVMGVLQGDTAVAGNASPDDVAYVQSRLDSAGERLLGVWVPHEPSVSNAVFSPLCMMAALPCFWPHLILIGPCVYGCQAHAKEVEMHTLYFITTHGFGKAVLEYKSTCCCNPGKDYTYNTWDSVQSVDVDNKGWGCFQTPSVHIVQNGVYTTGTGSNKNVRQNGVMWMVENPDEVAKEVRRALSASKAQGMSAPAVVQATAAQIRVFVSHESAPGNRQIVMVDLGAPWEATVSALAKACGVFGTEGLSVMLVPPAGAPMRVTSAQHLSSNDTLLLAGAPPV